MGILGRRWGGLACCTVLACALWPLSSAAYDPPLHQQFTFIAAKQLNRCLEGTALPRLTPLQVRYIAKSDVAQAQGSWIPQFHWGYYDRSAQGQKKLLWLIDTRLHDHFSQLERDLSSAREMGDQYSDLGYVVNYLQNMTSPGARRAGVLHALVALQRVRSFRRLSDRRGGAGGRARCNGLRGVIAVAGSRRSTKCCAIPRAQRLLAVQRRIDSLPVTWQAFWKLADDPEQFGEYGRAGNNFGRRVEFKCGDTKCVLLDKDPLYDAFALERHVDAVNATMRAMLWMQRRFSRSRRKH